MTHELLENKYFKWMCDVVSDDKHSRRSSYERLLRYLHSREFTYIIDMDGNRVEDGIDLRYRFAYDCNYNQALIASYLDIKPCSILEMMVALSNRCEENIMDDPDIGNRTGQWFWGMIDNLGLGDMDDERFNARLAKVIIDRFLNREYDSDGKGGLFTVKNCRYDMRGVEIWYQMNWYLNEI